MNAHAPTPPTGRKHRHCPALNGPITPADCGSQRGSRLDCPANCEFFPFGTATYELALKLDAEWVRKSLVRITSTLGRERFQAVMREHHVPMGNRNVELECALNRALHEVLFLRPGASGRTLAEDWETDGWAGLNNDERVMMRHRRHTLPTVVEVQRVVDAQTLICVDLLDPERPAFPVLDRAAASQAARFSRLLTLLSDYPHYSRLGLPSIPIAHHLWGAWRERFQARQAAQAGDPLPAKRFLALHLNEFTVLLGTLAQEHRQHLLDQYELHQCLASFRLRLPAAEIEARLQTRPDFRTVASPADPRFAPPAAHFEWLCDGDTARLEGAPASAPGSPPAILGSLRLYPEFALFESRTRLRHALARRLADQHLTAEFEFREESVLDLTKVADTRNRQGSLVAEAEGAIFGGAAATSGEPPAAETTGSAGEAPEATAGRLRQEHDQRYREFLDASVPELDGRSPRQAAVDPALRPRLVTIMKSHINGLEIRNRREPVPLSLDWVLDELGLGELR
jgi:hypothetical protein